MAEMLQLSLSLSAGLCAGLPTVVWAICSLRRHQEAGGTVSPFIISLLYSDIVELLLSPFVNTRLLEGSPCHNALPCWVLYSTFAEVRICGLHLHHLVALEAILSLTYPPQSSTHSVRYCVSSALSVTVWILAISCSFFTFGYTILLISYAVPVILAIITSVLTCRVLHSSAGPLGHKRPGLSELVVALFTLVVLYMPCLVLGCVNYPNPFYDSPGAATAVSVMSLRLLTDPLLCVLVCRETLKCQNPQKS